MDDPGRSARFERMKAAITRLHSTIVEANQVSGRLHEALGLRGGLQGLTFIEALNDINAVIVAVDEFKPSA